MDTMDSRSEPMPGNLGNKPNTVQLSRSLQATSLPAAPVRKDIRWERDFERIHYKPGTGKGHPERYNGKRYVGHGWPPLVEIDSNAGRGDCLHGTIKQWGTIISEAKAANKVPEELKAARYYCLGHVLDDLEVKENSDEVWVFVEEDEGVRALEEAKASSLPLEFYARARREKNRERAASRMQQKISSRSQSPHQMPSVNTLPDVRNCANLDSGNACIHEDSFMTAPPTLASRYSSQQLGQDYTYMTRAAEETKNDYEYVKGVGKVSINQQILQEIENVENHPSEQSPGSYALQDISFQLDQFHMAGLCVTKFGTDSSAAIAQEKNDSIELILKWLGKSDQTIRVSNGPEILCIPFKDVSAIFHNMGARKILFQDRRQVPGIPGQPLGYLVELSPVHDQTLQILRSCCYALTKEPARQCDQRPPGFFEEKIKSFIKNCEKKNSKPQRPNSEQAIITKVGALKQFDQISLARMRLNTTPTKGCRPAAQAKKGINPRKHNFTPSPPSSMTAKRRKSTVEQNFTASLASPRTISQRKPNPEHKVTMKGHSPEGLYYTSTLGTENILAVGLNDLVVRRLSEKEREKVGKRDRFDLFDGPWRIVKFDKPEKTYGISHEDMAPETEDDGNGTEPQLDINGVKQMGKTKVKLSFPNGSCASPWVELSRLLPVLDTKNLYSGEIHASNLTIADHEAFKKLRQDLITRKAKDDGEDTPMADTGPQPVISDEPLIHPVLFVEIKRGIFVAVIEVASQGLEDNDRYEVEKLRDKRLRRYDKDSAVVKEFNLESDADDPWVKRLIQERPELTANKIIVAEYKVHWAGWPNEDDTWTIGTGNIPEDFMVEYHILTDPLRDTPLDVPSANPENLICPDDLDKPKKKGRRRRARSSTESGKSISNRSKKAKQVSSRSEHLVDDVYDEHGKEKQKDKYEAGDKESRPKRVGGESDIENASLRSWEDSQAKENKDTGRTALQKQMGMTVQKLHAEQKAKTAIETLEQQIGNGTQNNSAPVVGILDDTSMTYDRDRTDDSDMAVECGETAGSEP